MPALLAPLKRRLRRSWSRSLSSPDPAWLTEAHFLAWKHAGELLCLAAAVLCAVSLGLASLLS